MPAGFEWDDDKNQANIEKHGISFEQARQIFHGPIVSWEDRRFSYNETRTISIGMMGKAVLVTVVHTDRSGTTRIISARAASRKERKRYYEEIY